MSLLFYNSFHEGRLETNAIDVNGKPTRLLKTTKTVMKSVYESKPVAGSTVAYIADELMIVAVC